MGNLIFSITSGLPVREFIRPFFLEIVKTSNETDTSLALQYSFVANVNRLNRRSACTNRCLDRASGREKQHINPCAHSVDERFLENILLKGLV